VIDEQHFHSEPSRYCEKTHYTVLSFLALVIVWATSSCRQQEPTPPPTQVAIALTVGPETPMPALTMTAFVTITSPVCLPSPASWASYTVQAGDTLGALAIATGASLDAIKGANCLSSDFIVEGQPLYLPVFPTPTPTLTPSPTLCAPSANWVAYIVQPGDTLSGLAIQTNVGISTIQVSNCLEGDNLYAGDIIYLPFRPGVVGVPQAASTRISFAPTATPTKACPPFNCVDPEVSILGKIAAPLPNNRELCAKPNDMSIRVEIGHLAGVLSSPIMVILGEKTFFAGCNFPNLQTVRATLIYPDGHSEKLLTKPSPQNNPAYAQAIWLPRCNLTQLVNYRIVMEDDQGRHAEAVFQVKGPKFQQILSIPESGPPGSFELFFCNYKAPLEAGISVEVELHSGVLLDNDICEFTSFRVAPLPISEQGEGHLTLYLPLDNDPSLCYLVKNHTPSLKDQIIIVIR